MQTIRHILRVPENHEIKIKLPKNIPENETVEVIIILNEKEVSSKQKMDELKTAMNDKLFLQDLNEVLGDFQKIDRDGW